MHYAILTMQAETAKTKTQETHFNVDFRNRTFAFISVSVLRLRVDHRRFDLIALHHRRQTTSIRTNVRNGICRKILSQIESSRTIHRLLTSLGSFNSQLLLQDSTRCVLVSRKVSLINIKRNLTFDQNDEEYHPHWTPICG